MSVTQIVITGGPCAGKTTCLSTLDERLTAKGYKVITVPEAATEMMMSGIKIPEVGLVEFEKMLIEFQLAKEKLAMRAAEKYPKAVVLLDRGIPDCRAYMTDTDYAAALAANQLNPHRACHRYDAVLHLVTAAKGAERFYTCANNPARQETDLTVARQADDRTQQAYIGHPHLRIIDNSTDFAKKISRLCGEVFSVLGIPVPLEIERKFLIDCPTRDDLMAHGAVPQKIVQAYLKSDGDTERRIRERGDASGFTCFYTEKKSFSPIKRIERERKISEQEYMTLLTEAEYVLTKTRWCFIWQGQYFELDTFDSDPKRALLEIELTDEKQQISLPPWCHVIREVSHDEAYHNHSIARQGFPTAHLSERVGDGPIRNNPVRAWQTYFPDMTSIL
ncbi:MAG: AAA family ATPase [Alphaproteobacteria bacterium]|nr:AAA family ATPase [Alphaproteobacteria bacterium]